MLIAAAHHEFHKALFSQVLDSLRASRMMVRHDGVSFHFSIHVRTTGRWVGRSGLIPWLANSLHFVQLGFYIWRRLKGMVSAAELGSAGELRKTENTLRVTSLEVLRACGNI